MAWPPMQVQQMKKVNSFDFILTLNWERTGTKAGPETEPCNTRYVPVQVSVPIYM